MRPDDDATTGPDASAREAGRRLDFDLTFDRVLFLRHLAIFAGAVIAYLMKSQLGIGWTALGIVASSAALNFACSFWHRRPQLAQTAEIASSVIGVGCWTALAAVTGGVSSPFLAGLWIEIILAAMLFALTGIVVVTLWSIASLWGLQLWAGLEQLGGSILLQTLFLGGMGALTYAVARGALHKQALLVDERDELDARLQTLEQQLEHEREVGKVGEGVARLAHGLKNATHSLRGFVSLIEPTVGDRTDDSAALTGLRAAIDDLEALARLTLEERREPSRLPAVAHCRPGPVVERVVREVSFAHSKVSWSIQGDAGAVEVPIAAEDLYEVLSILLRNAVEAMEKEGCGVVELRQEGAELRIAVCDEGPGIDAADLGRIFEPGFTTKAEGSGYGLFLARRIVAEAGGRLAARPAASGGAVLELTLQREPARAARRIG